VEFDKDLLDGVMKDFDARIRRSNEAGEAFQQLSVDVESEDGMIRLSVGPPGHLRSLALNPRIKRLEVDVIAERIVEMVNNATMLLQATMADSLREILPNLPVDDLIRDFSEMNRPPNEGSR
jgi:DNA-binding protein YbaB